MKTHQRPLLGPEPVIVKDTKHPEMYRIQYKDGIVGDMANLTWTKEKLRRYIETRDRRIRAGK